MPEPSAQAAANAALSSWARDGAGNQGAVSDEVFDPADNCPGTPNPEQADGGGYGAGDPCDAPFPTAFANQGDEGVVQTSVDGRLRPTQIVRPDAIVERV